MAAYYLFLIASHLTFISPSAARANTTSVASRAEKMLKLMTLGDKLSMMRGSLGDYVGNIDGNSRLGIPAIGMQDGPQGFRITKKTGEEGSSTAWPSSLNIAASFDSQLANLWATAMAVEFVKKGSNMQLAPGLGIARVPTAGRNFEYLCGEDPVLGSLLAHEVVKGIQSQGIIANAKHFINNEIETDRMTVSADVSERTRFQLYYPPFQAAIDAGVLSVMCSYNRVNGDHACQNNETLEDLRDELGFTGWVLSDWFATHSTVTSVRAGLDQELPVGLFLSETALTLALDLGEIHVADIDRSVLRILTAMYTIGLFDRADVVPGDPLADVTSDEHSALAREIAGRSIVLLKNSKSLLPINRRRLKRVAVFGDETTVSGEGSGHVTPRHGHSVTATEGISSALIGLNVTVEYFKPSSSDKDQVLKDAAEFARSCDIAVVVVATTSCEGYDRPSLELGGGQNDLVTAVLSGNSRTVVMVHSPGAALMPWATDASAILVGWMPGEQAGNALADVIFGSVNPSARLPLTMPNKDNEIEFTKEQFPGVGSPPIANYSEGLLVGYRWYDAHNVEPLFPFGHGLSYTTFQYSNLIIRRGGMSGSSVAADEDAISPTSRHPSETQKSDDKMPSSDSFPFSYSSPAVRVLSSTISRFDSLLTVTATVRNAGPVSGTEIAQLYIRYPEGLGEPLRQLRGIQVLHLEAGESKDATFVLSSRDLSIWDINAHAWALQCPPSNSSLSVHKSSLESEHEYSCSFTFYVGASSRDFRLQGAVSVYEKN